MKGTIFLVVTPTDSSEDRAASIFKVEDWSLQESRKSRFRQCILPKRRRTLNRTTQRAHRSDRCENLTSSMLRPCFSMHLFRRVTRLCIP
jgi:hypothetical protein